MKKFYLLLFLFFASYTIAQQNIVTTEIESLNEKGSKHHYTQKDSAFYYYSKSYELAKKNNEQNSLIESLFNVVGVASYHHDLKKMGKALEELENTLGSYEDFEEPVSNEKINTLAYYKGFYQLLLSDEKKSLVTFKSIIDNIKKIPSSNQSQDVKSIFSASYGVLGKIYMREGKYNLAKDLYNNAIRTTTQNDPMNLEVLYGNYNLLAELYIKQKKYLLSNKYLLKTFEFNKKKQNTNTVISSGFYLSENYVKLKKQDSAFYYLEEAKSQFNENPVFFSKYHLLKSAIHESLGEYKIALDELEKSLNEIRNRFGKEKNIEAVLVYNKTGELKEFLGDSEAAIAYYDIAIKELNQNFKNHVQLLKVSKNKAELLNSTKNKTNYQNSINTVNKAIATLDTLKPSFKSHADKLILIEDAFPIFESGIEAVYQLYKPSNDKKYIDQAFEYAEKSKAVLLLEALLATKATEFANIPDALLERERQLKSEIAFVEKQLNRASEKDNERENQLFDIQEEYRQFVNKVETDYKSYYDLKYNNKTISLEETQKLLKPEEKLISYFYGNKAIYAIGVDKKSEQIERIPIDASLEEEIKKVNQMLGDPKSDVSILAVISNKLYKRLVAPFITSEENKKLIIVADGLLNYIPFGALNTKENGLSYLMESYAVSYANSSTLNAQLLDREAKNGDLLAFAPSFKGEQVVHNPSRANLLPLPHNKREIQEILTSFKGQSYINEKASLQNFTTLLSDFGMLHLATHAVFDDTAPEYSYLAFSNTENEENLLYVSDLYNLKIDADMVTLSACETGIGELKRGEGFLSLARGFFYSGASSITSTLWKVNDASSTTLMNSFYKNLSKGMAKDLALQKAQGTFLEYNRENGLSHPYYWSGFIISGNTTPLTTPDYYWLWIGFAILLAAVAGFLVFRKEKG